MTRGRGARPLETLLFAVGTVGLLVLAAWLRLRPLDGALLDGDSFHVWDRAMDILGRGSLPWRGEGEGFHFGVIQAYLAVPLLAGADGLRDGIQANAVLHAMGVLLVALAGRRLAGPGAGLVAGMLYASWPQLVQLPAVGAWTYQAPLFVALALWAAGESLGGGRRWGAPVCGVALAVAASLHPFALAVALGGLAVLPWALRDRGVRPVLWAGLGFAVVIAPVAMDNAILRFTEPDRAAAYSLVSAREAGVWDLLRDGPLEACQGWPRPLALAVMASPLLALVLGLLPRTRRESPAATWPAIWLVAAGGALIAAGLALGYLRPYHWAVLAPLQALAPCVAVARWKDDLPRPLAWGGTVLILLALGLALPAVLRATAPPSAPGQLHLAPVEQLSDAIARDAGGAPLALALLADTSRCAHGQVDAFHAQLELRGADVVRGVDEPRHARRRARGYVVAELSPDTWSAVGHPGSVLGEFETDQGTVLRGLALADVASAERWLAQFCPDPPAGLELSRLRDSMGGMPGSNADPALRKARGEFRTFCEGIGPR